MAGLYIHIPFCHSKCSYCDFYSGLPVASSKGYVDTLVTELRMRYAEIPSPLTTIYIGGGTPSVLGPGELRRLVECINEVCDTSAVEEFTIEVNPEDVSPTLLDTCREVGINRISMGVQSLDDDMLRAINRRHTADQASAAIELLRAGGWNYSVDLMFGLPGQSFAMWQSDVDRMMAIRPPHFSAYLLSYEPGTRLHAMLQAGKVEEATEDLATQMQHYITETARRTGYSHYEISNYALPGFHSRHNSAYWKMEPYLGLGASAHSLDGSTRRFNPANIVRYTSLINRGKTAAEEEDETTDEIFNDHIITTLRTAHGLSLAKIRERFPERYVTGMLADAAPLLSAGELRIDGDRMFIPEDYWLKSDHIMRALLRV